MIITYMSISLVFHNNDVRQIIFMCKYNAIYGIINPIRNPIIKRNKQFCDGCLPLDTIIELLPSMSYPHAYIHQYALERTRGWREAAVVLGLYHMVINKTNGK